jgi:hypothetical protein
MADSKKPSGTTLMGSTSVLSLGNRARMGQESRRVLSPTEHNTNKIIGPPKTPQNDGAHRRDRSQRIFERIEKQDEDMEDEDTHLQSMGSNNTNRRLKSHRMK